MKFLSTLPETRRILNNRLEQHEMDIVMEENFQFYRTVQSMENTRRVLISHSRQYKVYGDFVVKIFENLNIDITKLFIYTSDNRMTAPNDVEIFDYLKDSFRENIYVIYIISKYFYDSNPCILETGAAWATNKNYSNLIVDIEPNEIDKPIDAPDISVRIGDIEKIDLESMIKFVRIVLGKINCPIPSDLIIRNAIDQAVTVYSELIKKLKAFKPIRKYQAHPLCKARNCNQPMDLVHDEKGNVIYRCTNPLCSICNDVKIY